MSEKISALPNMTALAGSELLTGLQAGVNSNGTPNQIRDFVQPYKAYRALLSQSGTDAPVAVVLENSANFPDWLYGNVGRYDLRPATPIPLDKLYIAGFSSAINGGFVGVQISSGSTITGYYGFLLDDDPVSVIELQFYDPIGNSVEFHDLLASDKLALPQILVYP